MNIIVANVEKNQFRSCDFDLILMDCNMPFMDGYESCHKIRQFLYEQKLTQPIISAVTGHTEPTYIKKSILCGMNQVLSKPVQIDAIKHLIKMLNFPIREAAVKQRNSQISSKDISIMEQHLSDPKVNNNIEKSKEGLDKFTNQLKVKRTVTKKVR